MVEYPYTFKKLMPLAYKPYVVYDIASTSDSELPSLSALAIAKYRDTYKDAGTNVLINWSGLSKDINKFYDYFSIRNLPHYSYNVKDIPDSSEIETVHLNSLADFDPSVVVDPFLSVKWALKKSALGFFSDRLGKKTYTIGVDLTDPAIVSDKLQEQLDVLVCGNTPVRIYLSGCYTSDKPEFFERYGKRVICRKGPSEKYDDIASFCIEAVVLSRCTKLLCKPTPLSLFARTILPPE